MPNRSVLKSCLRATLVLTCWASLCQAQNDNGRFVAKAYIAVLGRQAALHTAGMLPWGIDFNGWDYWTYWHNQGISRDSIVDTFVGSGEYTTLRSNFVTSCNASPVPNAWGFQSLDPPNTSDPNYANKMYLYMLYYYAFNRCPDADGYTFWLGYLNGGQSKAWILQNLVNTDEFNDSTAYYPPPSHKLRIDAFLNAISSSTSSYYTDPLTGQHTVTYMPRATAVTGINNPVLSGIERVYTVTFEDNEGSAEFSHLTTQIGSCQIQFTPGSVAGTGTLFLGATSAGITVAQNNQDVYLSNLYCKINATQSTVSNPGATMVLYLHIVFYSGGDWTGQADALATHTVNGPTSPTLGSVTVQPPVLGISKTHTGSFTQGQTGATYSIAVANQSGSGNTNGSVTVTDTVPSGLTLVSMTGSGWTCSANQCTRADVLLGGNGYPAITVIVNVSSTAPASVTNHATVSGGGAATASSDDLTTISTPQMYTISGQVMLRPRYSVAGTSAAPLANLMVTLSGGSTLSLATDSNGHYSFSVASGHSYTVSPQGAYSFAPSTYSVANLTSNMTITPFLAEPEDCVLIVNIGQTTTRTGGNEVTGSGTQYPDEIVVGNWSLTMTATLLFTPTGGAEQAVSAHTLGFGWSDGSGGGVLSTQVANALSALEPHGNGSYRTKVEYTGVCGGITAQLPVFYSVPLAIQRPTITPPAGSPYPAGKYAIWYLGGQPSQSGYFVFTTLTGNANLGTCSGCSPNYGWLVKDMPLGYQTPPLTFGSPGAAQTTVTSSAPSAGPDYDVGVGFSIDGFYSDEFWININTPVGTQLLATQTLVDPSCAIGYNSTYQYRILDLWGNGLTSITVNEQNDQFNDDFAGIVGWHHDTPNFSVDFVWQPATNWDPGGNAFTDFIGASSCGLPAWNPQTTFPHAPLLSVAVQDTPQSFYVGSASTGFGVFIRADHQTWYTDHGTCTQGGNPCQ